MVAVKCCNCGFEYEENKYPNPECPRCEFGVQRFNDKDKEEENMSFDSLDAMRYGFKQFYQFTNFM